MLPSTLPKTKINLADYPYRQDVQHRILIARLSFLEVIVLREIVYNSLTIAVEQLAKDLEVAINTLFPVLEKLSETKLFKHQQMSLIIDKDMRKYYELQLKKFDEDFQPNLHFLQSLLSRLPVHILPVWYAIPRSSDNIFESIIDHYFFTPRIYRQYLKELQFDHPILHAIIQDVYQASDFKVTAAALMEKYQLTHPVFEEYILLLEYHFVCCLSYDRIGDEWHEVVTPFAEWLEFLKFETQTKVATIQGPIDVIYHIDFSFIKAIIATLTGKPEQAVLDKIVQLNFMTQNHKITEKGKEWLSKSLHEQVVSLANDPLNILSNHENFAQLWNIRNLHLVEKSLQTLNANQWIEFDQFFQSVTIPLGDKEPITLKNKGKKWRYVIPTYTDLEKQFIQAVIIERLAELGVVATGFYQNKGCFCLTPFGAQFLH